MGPNFDNYPGFQQIPGMPILLQHSVSMLKASVNHFLAWNFTSLLTMSSYWFILYNPRWFANAILHNLSNTPFLVLHIVAQSLSEITCKKYTYRISANSYSFLRLKYLCRCFHIVFKITLLLCSKCCKNYLRAETIQGRKLFTEIWCIYKGENSTS